MSAPDPARLSLNTVTVKRQWSLAQAIDGCARHGIRALSPWRDQVAELGLRESVRRIRAHGLAVSGLCRGGFFGAPDFREDNLRAIEEAHALGAQCLIVVVGGLLPGSKDLRSARARVEEGLAAVLPDRKSVV